MFNSEIKAPYNLFLFFIFLYIYSDLQESDRGANT